MAHEDVPFLVQEPVPTTASNERDASPADMSARKAAPDPIRLFDYKGGTLPTLDPAEFSTLSRMLLLPSLSVLLAAFPAPVLPIDSRTELWGDGSAGFPWAFHPRLPMPGD